MQQTDQFLSCGRVELRLTERALSYRIRLFEELVYIGQKFGFAECRHRISTGRIRGVEIRLRNSIAKVGAKMGPRH